MTDAVPGAALQDMPKWVVRRIINMVLIFSVVVLGGGAMSFASEEDGMQPQYYLKQV
jgi:hypothetical protein